MITGESSSLLDDLAAVVAVIKIRQRFKNLANQYPAQFFNLATVTFLQS